MKHDIKEINVTLSYKNATPRLLIEFFLRKKDKFLNWQKSRATFEKC